MFHSIVINGVSTWENTMEVDGQEQLVGFHLVPTVRPHVSPPQVKTEYIDIPGYNGQLDYTEAFGQVYYGPRTGTWEFQLIYDLNDIDDPFRTSSMRERINSNNSKFSDWASRYSELLSTLHGKKCRLYLEDEPEYYYEGRLNIDNFSSNKENSIITIAYTLDPYKQPTFASTSEPELDWLWDDLFEKVIYYGKFDIDHEKARNLYNPSGDTITDIRISTNAPLEMTFDNDENHTIYSISTSGSITPPIELKHGDNLVTFTCDNTARVEIDYSIGASL